MKMRMRMRMMEGIFSSYCKYLSANPDPCTAENSITYHTFHINIPANNNKCVQVLHSQTIPQPTSDQACFRENPFTFNL